MSHTDVGAFEARMVAIEQEQAVIGALLRTNSAIDRIQNLEAKHFYNALHRKIFETIVKLVMANRTADIFTVHGAMVEQGNIDIDLAYLNAMVQSTPSAAVIGQYARIVYDRAMKRGLVELAGEIISEAQTSAADASELLDSFSSRIDSLARVKTTGDPERASESMTAHIQHIDEQYNGADSLGISTGLMDLDAALNGGPRRGNLVVLAARPKMGKTALALNIANHVALTGVAAVFSMEMTKSELHNRNLASIGRIDLNHLNDPKKMAGDDWPNMTRAVVQITNMDLYVDDQAGLSLLQVASKSRQIKRKAGALDLIVIDYLQLMSGPGDNRNAQIEAITRGLKSLAKELDCVVVLLSQLNRKLEDRPNKRPQPSDLRDSGSIEQDCDIGMFLYRDEIYHPHTQDKGIAELNIALNRHGAPRVVNMVYLDTFVRFEDVARGWHPAPPKTQPAVRRGFD